MGFPAIESPEVHDAENVEDAANTSTLFGFPAIESEIDSAEPAPQNLEQDSYGEYDDTQLIPAEELQREFAADQRGALEVNQESDSILGTIDGIPAVSPDSGNADADETAESLANDSAAPIVPGSVLTSEDEPTDNAGRGTLMGMSLTDLEQELRDPDENSDPARATKFAIPAVQQKEDQREPEKPTANENSAADDSSEVEDEELDSATAMWNPSQHVDNESDPHRQEILAKLRSQTKSEDQSLRDVNNNEKPDTESIPSAELPEGSSTGNRLGELPAPAPNKPGASGVSERPRLPDAAELKSRLKAKRESLSANRDPSAPGNIPVPSPGRNLRADSNLDKSNTSDSATDDTAPGRQRPLAESGVLGGSSYFKGQGDVHPEQPVKKAGEKRVKKLQLDSKMQAQTADNPPAEVVEPTLQESDAFDDDFAFADTSVGPGKPHAEREESAEVDASDGDLFPEHGNPRNAPPVVNPELTDRLPDVPPEDSVQPAAVTQEFEGPHDAMITQRVFGVLGGAGLLIAGAWGALTSTGLVPIPMFLLSAFFGLVSIGLTVLPLPNMIQKLGLGFVGLSQFLLGLVLLALVSATVFLPAVIVVCAGICVLMALVVPFIISKLN